MNKRIDKPNYTQIPNALLGDILPGNRISPGLMADLEGSELKVYLAVCRLTFGFHQEQRRASLTMIQDMTGLSRQGVIDAAKNLEEKHKLIERSLDGGVTLWKVVVNSVDQAEELCQFPVNPVDQLVNSVDQGSLLSRPPSKKETRKKPGKDSIAESTPDSEKWNNVNKKIVGDKFLELTHIKPPPPKSKTAGAWWGWLYEIFEMAGKDSAEACRIMEVVVSHSISDRLTITSPKSLLTMANTVASGQPLNTKNGANGSSPSPPRASPPRIGEIDKEKLRKLQAEDKR